MIAVTEVTTHANADDLTDADYREVYSELRDAHSLRQFVEIIHTTYSIAWWSKYERAAVDLTRTAKNELRAAVGLPPLPLSVEQAVAAIDPDATVYQVGALRPTRVIMIGHPAPLHFYVNGALTVDEFPPRTTVTAVTRRPKRHTVAVHQTTWQALNQARQAKNQSWDAFLAALLAAQEAP